jgi:hypothetical protein
VKQKNTKSAMMEKRNTLEEETLYERFELLKDKLQSLDRMNEESIFCIWRKKDEELICFENGGAVIAYGDGDISLAQKMIFRYRSCGDVCYFWNALDPYNRRLLLSPFNFDYDTDLDFFVYFGNNHCSWLNTKLVDSTITIYFSQDEQTKKQNIRAYLNMIEHCLQSSNT